MSDEEYVWGLALESSIGPPELWSRSYREARAIFSDAEFYAVAKATSAFTAIVMSAFDALHDQEHQERLFGEAAGPLVRRAIGTPAWTALFAIGAFDHLGEQMTRTVADVVSDYILNVEGGLMDATHAFYDAEEAD